MKMNVRDDSRKSNGICGFNVTWLMLVGLKACLYRKLFVDIFTNTHLELRGNLAQHPPPSLKDSSCVCVSNGMYNKTDY